MERRRAALSDEARKRKCELDRLRSMTRVNLGMSFKRWRELREARGCKTDAQLACILLDHLERNNTTRGALENLPPFSTHINTDSPRLPVCPLSASADEVVVNLQCLLQLFQKCSTCSSGCSVSMEDKGRTTCITQRCQVCHYSREWRSHPSTQVLRDRAATNQQVKYPHANTSNALNIKQHDHADYCKKSFSEDKENIMKIEEDGFELEIKEKWEPKYKAGNEKGGEEGKEQKSEVQENPNSLEVTNSVILTPGVSGILSNDNGGLRDSSLSGKKRTSERIKKVRFEDEEAAEEMNHEDVGGEEVDEEEEEDDLEMQDDSDDEDWHPDREEDLKRTSISEDEDSSAESSLEVSKKSVCKSRHSPDEDLEVLLPLVWCSVCDSSFKRSCFRKCHSKLYGCLQCGIKKHKHQMDCSSGSQEGMTSSNLDACYSTHDTSNGDDQTTCGDKGWGCLPSPSNPEDSMEDSNTNGGGASIPEMIDSGLVGHSSDVIAVTSKNGKDEATSNFTEETTDVHSQSLHINDLSVRFSKLTDYEHHATQCHGVQRFRSLCGDCGKIIHMVNKVDGGPPHICEHKVKPLVCSSCGRRFVTEDGLQKHVKMIHSEKYLLTCRYCTKVFKSPEDKEEHEKSHKGQKLKYHCPDCPQRFPTRSSLCAHRKSHWPNGKHICETCNKGFRHEAALLRHKVVHTGVKPYTCDQCDRSFNQPGHLKSHIRVHTGERPFMCHECGQCFNHNVSLKNHVQRYHGPGAEEKKGKDDVKKRKRNN